MMVCFYEVTARCGSSHVWPTKLPLSFSRLVSQCITFEPTETRISFPVKQRSGCFQNISHRIRQEHLTHGLQCRSSPIGKTQCLPIISADLLTADDVARLSVEVEGWSVIVEASGVLVGHVEEVLQLASVSDSADNDYDDVIKDHENTCNDDGADISSNKDNEINQVSKTSEDDGSESGPNKRHAIERIPVRDPNRIEEYMLRISGEKMMGRRLEFLVPLVPAIVTAVDRQKRLLFINVGFETAAEIRYQMPRYIHMYIIHTCIHILTYIYVHACTHTFMYLSTHQ